MWGNNSLVNTVLGEQKVGDLEMKTGDWLVFSQALIGFSFWGFNLTFLSMVFLSTVPLQPCTALMRMGHIVIALDWVNLVPGHTINYAHLGIRVWGTPLAWCHVPRPLIGGLSNQCFFSEHCRLQNSLPNFFAHIWWVCCDIVVFLYSKLLCYIHLHEKQKQSVVQWW